MHFKYIKKDYNLKIKNNYLSEWLYFINIIITIDNKLLDYHYTSHNIDDYYSDEKYILAFDKKLLYNDNDSDFFIINYQME